MEETKRFVELLDLSTRQAGAVARYLQGKVQVEKKLDEPTIEGQALTAVDLATQDLILHQLHRHWPEVAVDAEEDTALAREFERQNPEQPLIVLDPVDGTYNYTTGSQEYAVMAGLIMDGFFRAAVIRYPTRDETLWAIEGEGCFVRRGSGETRRVTVNNTTVTDHVQRLLVSPRVPEAACRSFEALADEVVLCRCSAFDGPCLALGNANGAVAENRADRRRALALYLSLAAGGAVLMGERQWRGEDPETIEKAHRPTICAPDAAFAQKISQAWSRATHE